MPIKILLVDDNVDILVNVRDYFEMRGWTVETATTGRAAVERLERDAGFDLIVLDVGLPDVDGVALCRSLRSRGMKIPVLMLTARDAIEDRVAGLTGGADDYVVKPFSLRELAARIEALLRRAFGGSTDRLKVGDLVYDLNAERVSRGGVVIKLNPTCRRLLKMLMLRSPAVVERAVIEEHIWAGRPPATDSLRSNLYLLRQAVDKPFPKALIRTHPGLGWSISDEED